MSDRHSPLWVRVVRGVVIGMLGALLLGLGDAAFGQGEGLRDHAHPR